MAVAPRVGRYFETEELVPYRQTVGDLVQDQWGNTHAFLELRGPGLAAMGDDQLAAVQAAQVALLEALPDNVVQVQFAYATCGDYRAEAVAHTRWSSDRHLIANRLRVHRAERLIADCHARRVVRPTVLVALSCAGGERDGGGEPLSWRPGARWMRRTPTLAMTDAARECLALATALLADVYAMVGFEVVRWGASEIAAHLYRLWNPVYCQEIALRYDTATTPFNDAWLVQDWQLDDGCWRIGVGEFEHYHGFVSLTEEPQETAPGLVERLTTQGPVRDVEVVQAIRRTDRSRQTESLRFQLQRALTAMRENRTLYERIFDPGARTDPGMQHFHVEEAERAHALRDLLADLVKGAEFQVVSQLTVHTWAKTRAALNRNRQAILARFAEMASARAEIETFPTVFLTFATMPGSCSQLLRWRTLRSRMACDLTPVSAGFQTAEEPVCFFESASGGIVTLDLFSRTNVPAPLTMVSGGSGSGKSFLVNQLILQHLVGDTRVFILDVGGSYRRLIELIGGVTLRLDPEQPFCFNPFQVYGMAIDGSLRVPTPAERGRIVACLETLLIPPDEAREVFAIADHNLLDTAVEQCFADAAREARPFVRMTDLARKLGRLPGGDAVAPRVLPFTTGREYGAWIDGPTAVDLRSDLIAFDLQGIRKDARLASALTSIIVNYLHDLVSQRPDQRKIVVMDEMWQAISHPRLMNLVIESWKTFRKLNAVVIGSTQSIGGDIADTPVAHAIIDNTQTWFLLHQGEHAAASRTARLLNLTEGQADILANLRTKTTVSTDGRVDNWRSCLLKRGAAGPGARSGELRIRATPMEYWLATTDPNETALFDRTRRANAGDLDATLEQLGARYPAGLAADQLTAAASQ